MRLIRRSIIRLRVVSSEIVDPYGITAHQYLALVWISDHEGLTQSNLVIELDSDANTISAIIRRLDNKKLITRKKHATDGRAFCLYATTLGKQLVSKIRPRIDRLSLHLYSLLPQGQEAAIADWLESIAAIRELGS